MTNIVLVLENAVTMRKNGISFHDLKLMYLPKSTGFTMLTCIIITMLAAIQNQVYIEQKNSAKVHHIAQWSRASKKHVVKKRTEYDSVFFKNIIIGEVNNNLTSNAVLDMDTLHEAAGSENLPWRNSTVYGRSARNTAHQNVLNMSICIIYCLYYMI